MGWTFSIYPVNILEHGTVTVSGTTDTGFPVARLYDRSKGFFWKGTATEAKTFKVDQGASGNLPVDILAVGFNNFAGANIDWQYSDDDATYYNAVSQWAQASSGEFVKELSSQLTHRYWKLMLSSLTNPRCSEIFMGPAYTFNAERASKPSGSIVSNVQWNRTMGGIERSTKFGGARRTRSYTVWLDEGNEQFTDLLEAIEYLDDLSKPFFFRDHLNDYFWAKFSDDPFFDFDHNVRTHVTLNVTEIL